MTITANPVAINPLQAALGASGSIVANEMPEGLAIAGPVSSLAPSQPWTPSTAYALGAQVTKANPVGLIAAGLTFTQFTCIVPGVSGATPPTWPSHPGIGVTDGTVLWISTGIFLP